MATTEQRVEELVFRGKAEGIDQTKAALDGLAAAHGRAGQAAESNIRVHETAGRAMRNPTVAFQELQKRLEGSPAAWKALERGLRVVSRAADEGKNDIAALDGAVDELLRNFQRAVAPKLSPDIDLAPMKAAIGAAKSFDDQTRAMLRGMLKQAEESQEALRAQAKAADDLAERTARFRAELDPLTAAQAKLNAELAEARALRDAGAITDDEVIRRQQQLGKEFDNTSRRLTTANDNIRLTQDQMKNLGYQTNDLLTMWAMGASPFQIISSQAGQIVQALQDGPGGLVGSLRAIGAGAMTGARAAVSALGPVGIALTGITAAVGVFAYAMRKDVPDATKTLEKHEAVLSEVSARYEGLEERVKRFGQNAAEVLGVQVGAVGRDLREVLGAQRKELERAFVGSEGFFGGAMYGGVDTASIPALPKFEPIRKQVEEFRQTLRAGNPDVDALRRSLGVMYATAGNDQELRKAIEATLQLTNAMAGTQTAIRQNEEALRALDPALQRITALSKAYRSAMDELDGFGPAIGTTADRIATAFDEASASAQSYGEAVAAGAKANAAMAELARPAIEAAQEAQDRLANLKLSPDQRTLAEIRQRADAEIAELRRVNGSAVAIAAAEQKRDAETAAAKLEFSRAEQARRDGYALDLRALDARTAAEKAAVEAERVRIDMMAQGHSAAEANARAEEARTLSLVQAQKALSEATRQRIEGGQAQVSQAEFELTLVGKSAGEVARLTTEYRLMEAAKRAAAEVGVVVDPSEISAIRDQAAEIGRATEALQRLNFERDVLFERQQATRSPEDQRIAEQLRSMGVDFDSVQGRADAAQLRLNNRLHETNDLIYEMRDAGKEAFFDLVQAIGSGEDAMGAIAKAFSGLGQQLASAGFDRLFGGLFGGQGASGSSGGGLAGLATAAGAALGAVAGRSSGGSSFAGVSSSVPIPTARPAYTAQDVASVSGSMMSYASRFNSSIDNRLLKILNTAATRFDMRVEAISGLRPGDSRFHGRGLAADVAIYGANGQRFDNYQSAADFRVYEQFAQEARRVQQEIYPELENMFRWGGYFSGGKGKYGALDSMHFDLGGDRVGMGGGSWSDGLTASQRRLWPGAQSVGMSEQQYQRVIAKGTAAGVRDGVKATSYDLGPYDPASPRTGGNAGQGMTGGQRALGILGAGLGIFGSGYESGNPLMGGVQGALGGWQAASALGVAGPIGLIGGAALGILGGIFGGRAKRKAAHQEAAARWEEMQPQYEAFKQSLSGEGQGDIRGWITNAQSQLSAFMKVGGAAWKNGTGNSTQEFWNTGTKMWDRFYEMTDEFREGFEPLMEDLSSGEGLGGAFAKGRAATKDLKAQIEGMIDDVSIAFGSDDIGVPVADFYTEASKTWEEARNAAIERAKKSAGEYSLSLLYTAEVSSDVEKSLDGFRGTAAGLQSVLEKLGWTAEDAAADIKDRLNQAIAEMGRTFVDGFQREINDLQGTGYLNDIADLIKARDTGLSDAAALGVDPGIVRQWFNLALRDIVVNADLTTDALKRLKETFPELADVTIGVTDQMASAFDAAQDQLRSVYQSTKTRLEGLSESIKSFLDDIALDSNLSDLNAKDRFTEAQRIFRETSAKASAGDEDAQAELVNVSRDYLDAAKDYYVTSEDYYASFDEVKATLKSADAKATSELDILQKQVGALIDISETAVSIEQAIREFKEAFGTINQNRNWGAKPDVNKGYVSALQKVGLYYTGDFGSGGFQRWLDGLSAADRAKAKGAIGYQNGGVIPGLVTGGIVGNGMWNRDSVLARYVGGGEIALAGGEHVTRATSVNDNTLPWLQHVNRTGRVPDPYPTRSFDRRLGSAQAGEAFATRSDLRETNRRLDRIADILGSGFNGSIEAADRMSVSVQQSAAASRRAAIKARKAA